MLVESSGEPGYASRSRCRRGRGSLNSVNVLVKGDGFAVGDRNLGAGSAVFSVTFSSCNAIWLSLPLLGSRSVLISTAGVFTHGERVVGDGCVLIREPGVAVFIKF